MINAALLPLKITAVKTGLERIKIVGPDSKSVLEKIFEEIDLSSVLDSKASSLFLAKANSQLEIGIEHFDFDSEELSAILVNDQFINRKTIDVIANARNTKIIWSKLVTNRAHLVGGLRDYKVLNLAASRPLFPFFGFCDTEIRTQLIADKVNNWSRQLFFKRRRLRLSR